MPFDFLEVVSPAYYRENDRRERHFIWGFHFAYCSFNKTGRQKFYCAFTRSRSWGGRKGSAFPPPLMISLTMVELI